QVAQAAVDLGAAAAGGDDPVVLVVGGGADPAAQPVVGDDLEPPDVVDGLAVRLGRGAAGGVADHAAERAVAVRGRLRTELQAVRGELPVQLVQHDARLHHAGAGVGVDRHQVVAVLRPVDDDGGVGALAAEAGAAAAGQYRRAVPRA